jgi:hypothetical protein
MKKLIFVIFLTIFMQGCVVVTRAQLRESADPADHRLLEELNTEALNIRHDIEIQRYR